MSKTFLYIFFKDVKPYLRYGSMVMVALMAVAVVLSGSRTGMLACMAALAVYLLARRSLAGKTTEVLPEYEKLYRRLGRNGLFLYNHAAELHEVKEYEKSIAVFGRCMRYFNDMDVQMLLADNYKALGKYEDAERHLETAAAMCPVRFMPLYELAKLYEATGRCEEAIALAKTILNKRVKVPSPTVNAIENEMRQLIEAEAQEPEDSVPAAESRTSEKTGNKKQREPG